MATVKPMLHRDQRSLPPTPRRPASWERTCSRSGPEHGHHGFTCRIAANAAPTKARPIRRPGPASVGASLLAMGSSVAACGRPVTLTPQAMPERLFPLARAVAPQCARAFMTTFNTRRRDQALRNQRVSPATEQADAVGRVVGHGCRRTLRAALLRLRRRAKQCRAAQKALNASPREHR